jgi:hypothetical protein
VARLVVLLVALLAAIVHQRQQAGIDDNICQEVERRLSLHINPVGFSKTINRVIQLFAEQNSTKFAGLRPGALMVYLRIDLG